MEKLGAHWGIAAEYEDNWGRRHATAPRTLRALLQAMGVRTGSRDELLAEFRAAMESVWRPVCDPVQVVTRDGRTAWWSCRVPAESGEEGAVRIQWEVHEEGGRFQCGGAAGPGLVPVESALAGGRRCVRFQLPVPAGLPIGYYDLLARARRSAESVEGRLRLILVPPRCFAPQPFTEGARLWGLAVQLYALRSRGNWGVGDFGDLAELVEWAAKELGAGLIGLNPLHALKNARPYHISPYSPDSRLYLNGLYLAVERIPDFNESVAAKRLLRDERLRATLNAVRESERVDYDAVWAAKRRVLGEVFATFEKRHLDLHARRTARGRAFERFVQEEGEALERFSLFQALSERFQRELPDLCDWTDWPEPFRHPGTPAVQAFQAEHQREIRFHQYLQWVARDQLAAAQALARGAGMAVGLYLDQALGSSRSGSDAWAFQDLLAVGADCGAPPDAFALQGQNWGLPPINPLKLRAGRYRLFIELLRKTMQYGGAIRLDHVMALVRLFWIPRGFPAAEGTYVAYPADELLGILALESVRHRAMVVGEDLGTVPAEIRDKLAAYGVLSYRVLWFEREHDGAVKRPPAWPTRAAAVVTTHDLPTLAGFWEGRDIEARARCGLFPDEQAKVQAWEDRRRDKRLILEALLHEGLLNEGLLPEGVNAKHERAMTPELRRAIHAYLARTPAWIMLATLEDCLGVPNQANLPGTLDCYPNWSLKIPLPLEELRQEPTIRDLAVVLSALRPFALRPAQCAGSGSAAQNGPPPNAAVLEVNTSIAG